MTAIDYTAVRKGAPSLGSAISRKSRRINRLLSPVGARAGAGPALISRLPNDLTEWVGSIALVRLALQAVDQAGLRGPQPVFPTASSRCRPNMLLTLLTYAYAKGLTGSRDIELAIPGNQALKYIAAGDRPDWNTLRLFRRRNVALIRACLAEILRQAWEQRYPGAPKAVTDRSYTADALDRWLAPTTPDFYQEAVKRVSLAIQTDTLLADE
jgi:hypothetical protein